jgi:hypothetical protein
LSIYFKYFAKMPILVPNDVYEKIRPPIIIGCEADSKKFQM